MHQNLAIILRQFNYGKNSFIVLIPARVKVARNVWQLFGEFLRGVTTSISQLSFVFDTPTNRPNDRRSNGWDKRRGTFIRKRKGAFQGSILFKKRGERSRQKFFKKKRKSITWRRRRQFERDVLTTLKTLYRHHQQQTLLQSWCLIGIVGGAVAKVTPFSLLVKKISCWAF